MSFELLGLCSALLKSVAEQGYTKPTPIQLEAIPAVLSQRDVMAVAQTGTGKTAGFTLPMVQLLSGAASPKASSVRALVITPTRELATQVLMNVQNYIRHMNIQSAGGRGGVRIEPQITQLQAGVDILVATPGRLIDLYKQQAIRFDQLEILVLDEADRMLDLGFIDEMSYLQSVLPSKRQTLMFSATFSKQIKSLASGMLNNPLLIEVAAANSTVDSVKQRLHPVDKARKSELLIHLIKRNNWPQVLVFSRTKLGADSLASQLETAGISAASIHANRTQHARTLALEGFRGGSVAVLVATDIASRGIDVSQLSCVINVDLPYVAEDYVHRIGRTGRAGSFGLAVSLFSEDETKQLRAIERLTGLKFKHDIVPGFAPKPKPKQAVNISDDDDEYGNFEPDPEPQGRAKGRGSRQPKVANRSGKKRPRNK